MDRAAASAPSPVAFARVIENSWTSAAGDFITRDSWRRLVEPGLRPRTTGDDGRYYGGLDLGLMKDRTAFSIVHVDGERIVLDLLEVWEGTTSDPVSIFAIETYVDDAYRRFPGLRVTLDPWQAEGTFQKLARAGRRIEKFTFSPKSIHGLSTTLYQSVQDETLRVYDDRELEHEVLSLQTRETPEGWRFDHRRGGYSDRVVALAMALQAAVKLRTATQPLRLSTGWKARARADAQREVVARGLKFCNPGSGIQPPRTGNSDWQQYFKR
jgi:phage terminase large subunit-like protein